MMFRYENEYYSIWELHLMMVIEIICSNYSSLIGFIIIMFILDMVPAVVGNRKIHLIIIICYIDILLMSSNHMFNNFWGSIYRTHDIISCFFVLILHNTVLFPIYYAKNYFLFHWLNVLV